MSALKQFAAELQDLFPVHCRFECDEPVLVHDLNVATHPRNNPLSHALYACDEFTGMITATALVRPTKSVIGLEVSSVRKKMKTKGFAAGVNRDDLYKGAEELGIDLDEHIANVIQAMSRVADTLGLAGIQATEPASLG